LRGVYVDLSGTVQLLVDELDDGAADEIGDGAAQLVFDERLKRLPGRRGHVRKVYDRVGEAELRPEHPRSSHG
jgi:hypothetical protein